MVGPGSHDLYNSCLHVRHDPVLPFAFLCTKLSHSLALKEAVLLEQRQLYSQGLEVLRVEVVGDEVNDLGSRYDSIIFRELLDVTLTTIG